MNYLDTSALIKRFVAERGSELVDSLVAKNNVPVTTSKITYVEAKFLLIESTPRFVQAPLQVSPNTPLVLRACHLREAYVTWPFNTAKDAKGSRNSRLVK
ncbi:type II toxin-antitoxin system VapC family toxin [Acidobacteria bacterium AH-259-L09]|nr:type II toxin-antitoxin system VapC family toxin [Acidobacteria bacterium AH-259-L09]